MLSDRLAFASLKTRDKWLTERNAPALAPADPSKLVVPDDGVLCVV